MIVAANRPERRKQPVAGGRILEARMQRGGKWEGKNWLSGKMVNSGRPGKAGSGIAGGAERVAVVNAH